MIEQKTLRASLRFKGHGLHTGAETSVEVKPAGVDTGLVFVLARAGRSPVRVPALAENVIDTSRATVLGRDGVTVSTTEHLLSALFGMGVTNAEIFVEGPEIPSADGSARTFVSAIQTAGFQSQGRPQPAISVSEPYVARSGDRMVAVLPSPAFRVRVVVDFPAPIGTQYLHAEIDPPFFRDEIAAARTFGYLHEVEGLRSRGLALGGTLENALVFSAEGPMQPLRWENEVVRHKVLDLVGDLALLGAWPQCEIVAIKSGHELHAAVTRELRKRIQATPTVTAS